MRSGKGIARRRSEKPGGKSTRLKGSNGPINMNIESVADAIEHSVGVVFPPKTRVPEPNFLKQVDAALARIHSNGRVFKVGQAAATT
ncbi:MAG: hypothetical protein M1324_04060 [Patescibacteria group bacterium]|nr:hypothetical protein [Patescibacteria group bacterium]